MIKVRLMSNPADLAELSSAKTQMNQSILNYLQVLKKIKNKEFEKETKEKVINKYSTYYEWFYPVDSPDHTSCDKPVDKKTNKIFRELSILTHPDKCPDNPKATQAFVKLSELKFKPDDLEDLYNKIVESGFVDPISQIIDYVDTASELETQIKNIKSEPWYVYTHDKYYRSLFVSPECLSEVEVEAKRLLEENNRMNEEIEKLKKARDDIFNGTKN